MRQIQGTLNGIGERCGNANLDLDHPDAGAEAGLSPSRFETGIGAGRLAGV